MPLIALAPALIAAGGGIGTALINKKKGSVSGGGAGATPLLPPGLDHNALLGDINAQRDLAKLFQGQGADLLGQGRSTLGQPLKYYSDILGGDRTKIMEAMAPGIAAINAQFRAPIKDAMIGGRGSALAPDLEASRQSAISNQIFQAQPAAADKLTGIADTLMNLGVGQERAGADVLGSAAKETLDYNAIIRGIQAQAEAGKSSALGKLGETFGPILAQILGGVLGGKGGTNPPAPDLGPALNPDLIPIDSDSGPGGDDLKGGNQLNPALLNSLIQLGTQKPDFASTWLDSMKKSAA